MYMYMWCMVEPFPLIYLIVGRALPSLRDGRRREDEPARVGAGATALTTCRSGGRRLVVRANGLPSSSPAASSPSPPSAPAAPLPLAVRKRIQHSLKLNLCRTAGTHSFNQPASAAV